MTPRLRATLFIGAALLVSAYAAVRLLVLQGRRPHEHARRASSASQPLDSTGCKDRPPGSKRTCYRAAFARYIATSGVESALATLRTLTTADADVARDAHVYAHGIGIDAFQLHPDVSATFPHCSALFSSGCYHGVMQAYFELRGTADARAVNAACRAYERTSATRWLLFQCLHGMGHGLDMMLDHDLPRALHACDRLAGRWRRESCYGGAFMENIMHVIEPDHPATMLAAHEHGASHFRPIDRADPLYPCSVSALRYGRACYMIQTAAILYLNGGNIAGAARTCDRAPHRFRPTCYQSLGRDISSYAAGSAQRAVKLCDLGAPALRRWCDVGAAKSFVDQAATPQPGFALCAAVTRLADRTPCYEAVGEQIAALADAPSVRGRMCASADTAFVAACRRGARVVR